MSHMGRSTDVDKGVEKGCLGTNGLIWDRQKFWYFNAKSMHQKATTGKNPFITWGLYFLSANISPEQRGLN